jgi:hypothetical protein
MVWYFMTNNKESGRMRQWPYRVTFQEFACKNWGKSHKLSINMPGIAAGNRIPHVSNSQYLVSYKIKTSNAGPIFKNRVKRWLSEHVYEALNNVHRSQSLAFLLHFKTFPIYTRRPLYTVRRWSLNILTGGSVKTSASTSISEDEECCSSLKLLLHSLSVRNRHRFPW